MYICICKQITDKQIKAAIDEGAQSLRDLRSELGVASECGQCGQCARAILKEHTTHVRVQLPLSRQNRRPVPTTVFPLFATD